MHRRITNSIASRSGRSIIKSSGHTGAIGGGGAGICSWKGCTSLGTSFTGGSAGAVVGAAVGMGANSGNNRRTILPTTFPTGDARIASPITCVSPSPDNNLVSTNPSETAVGAGGVAVGDGIVPNGVSVLTMTSGGGNFEVGVLIASTVATIVGGVPLPSIGPGVF